MGVQIGVVLLKGNVNPELRTSTINFRLLSEIMQNMPKYLYMEVTGLVIYLFIFPEEDRSETAQSWDSQKGNILSERVNSEKSHHEEENSRILARVSSKHSLKQKNKRPAFPKF